MRGAVQASANEPRAILDATDDLMRALLERNSLQPADLVSCVFTVTADLDAEFPAVAAREVGLDAVPLLCAREIPVPDSMPRVIRALMHYYAAPDHDPEHVYLGATRALRSDLHSAQ